jgi:hypothetical protein
MYKHKVFLTGIAAAVLTMVAVPSDVRGDLTYSTGPQGGVDGTDSATVSFAAGNGVLIITVTNNDVGQTMALGQEVSGISFTISGFLSTPNAFTNEAGEIQDLSNAADGTTWNAATPTGTPFSEAVSSNADNHWRFSTSGSTVFLATAGTHAPGGAPTDMILPSSGIVSDGVKDPNHNPSDIGPMTFQLTVPGITSSTVLTSANFTNVNVAFGTAPDNTFPTTFQQPQGAPEPSTLAIAGLGAAAFVAYGVRKRRKS